MKPAPVPRNYFKPIHLVLAFAPFLLAWTMKSAPVKYERDFEMYSVPPSKMVADILTYVNEDRAQHGLPALKLNEVESSIASKHSRDMASGKVPFGHSGLNARAKAIRKALGQISSVGENVASGPMNAREVVDGWLNSPGHKRNIEGNFTLTGIGYASDGKGNIFFTQIFSR
jgi:uncharacterized protein YkwD